ncbi:ATP-binding protein [Kitasatospora sp. NPDC059408]|uniref:ATP-binding protein n=1 Tax=Kitasatospora sp. NPDC059408 TaxID=3346823 RepID=UPI0036B1D1D1
MNEQSARLRRSAPRTLRARATVAVTAAFTLALVAASAAFLAALRADLWEAARDEARRNAVSAVEVLEARSSSSGGSYTVRGGAAGAVSLGDPGTTTAQWDPGPVAQHPSASVSPTSASPSAGAPSDATAIVNSGDGRFQVAAVVDFDAARATLLSMSSWMIPILLVLVLFCAWLTWTAVGRVLAPVEALRREVADITAGDLHRRLPVPGGRDEIARLATAMNATLDRLDHAVARLRTFTGDVSHELRSPLATLRTRLELSLAHPDRTDWPRTVADALEDTDELAGLVDDLLLLARLDAHRPGRESEVDLAELARTHGAVPSNSAAPVVLVDAPGPATVRGAPAHLVRVLTNLVDNARRHARAAVHVRVATEDGSITLEVADDGPGIPPADRERVFERFTQLDAARTRGCGGAGLGLAIARSIATTHHGTLTAEAPAGTVPGARLVLRLPAAERRPRPRTDGS